MYSIRQQSFVPGFLLRKPVLLGLRYLVCGVVAFFVLIPILTVVIGGFKTNGELNDTPFAFPHVWHWENYASVLSQPSFWQALENSGMIMLATVGLLLLISCPAAFALARIQFRGREVV